MSRRHQEWPVLLHDFIEQNRACAFTWGEHDCCLFTCNAILQITGVEIAADFRGKYSSALGAVRILAKSGGVEGIAASVCAANEFPEVGINFAQRGDAILVDVNSRGEVVPATLADQNVLGICMGATVAIPGHLGLEFIPLWKCRRAWRIQ
jgi:hypothetical protein